MTGADTLGYHLCASPANGRVGNEGMNRVAVSAAVGVAVATVAFALPFFGLQLSPAIMMTAAAALSLGAASSILTSALMAKPPAKGRADLMSQRLASSGLITKFPKDALSLSIRPETRPELLDAVKNPDKYTKDIVVWLRGGKEEKFNPVVLRQLFTALSRRENFQHVILTARNDEFIGYIPAAYARTDFCGPNAEGRITRYVVDVFTDQANSVNLREILGGAGKTDVISDSADVADAIKRMAGGFKRLIVLHNGYHRKPVGFVDFNELMSGALTGTVPKPLGLAADLRRSA